MRYWRLLIASVLLAYPATAGLQAQTAVTAAGGNISGGGGTVSYSVGQIVYTTISSVDHSVAQGVQQPYEISVITEIPAAGDISLSIAVYPNPASDRLILRTGEYESGNLSYRLYDLNGVLLLGGKVIGRETTIAVGSLKPSVYLLSITDGSVTVKTFRIIKN